MATYLAAQGEPCRGLVLYAYPLHPAGRPDKVRADHLPSVAVPMLFFSGSRDAMARSDLVDAHLRSLPRATVEIIEGANHSFRLPKASGTTTEEVLGFLVARTVTWVEAL